MLFLIGTRDSNVKNGILLNEKCPKCEVANSLQFSIYKKYTHVTLIPLFPVGNSVFITCRNCDENFNYDDLNEIAQFKLKNEKVQNSYWMFAGSIIVLFFLVFTINNYFNDNEETSRLIKKPIQGDVYNLKFSNGYYSSMRIDKVTNDSIHATHNNFDAYMPYEIDNLDKSENYTNRKVNYSRKDILKLYDKGEIIKIRRKIKNVIFK